MRRKRKIRKSTTERKTDSKSKERAKGGRATVKGRLETLESRVEALEREVFQPLISFETSGEYKRRPGKPYEIEDDQLWDFRDQIIDRLEGSWPDIVPRLLAAGEKEELDEALKPLGDWQSYVGKRFLSNTEALLDFLQSDRFNRKPPRRTVVRALNGSWADKESRLATQRATMSLPTRRIANAMAGVPKISWRTSLDRCSRLPSPMAVQKRTDEHYRKLYRVPSSQKKRG
jgi:hypothetical protein